MRSCFMKNGHMVSFWKAIENTIAGGQVGSRTRLLCLQNRDLNSENKPVWTRPARPSTARRDRTCLILLVMQAQSLDCQRRVKLLRRPKVRIQWITCESNAVQAPYQRAQGNQPVVIQLPG